MMKRLLVVALAGITLAGCASNNTLSGDVYSASQAGRVQNVSYGTLLSVRQVQIQGGDENNVVGAIGGAVLGGMLGNTIGGGSGRRLATAGGAVAGGVAGQGVQSAMNRSTGLELEIRRDDGSTVVVVQKAGPTAFTPGQRVMMVGSGSSMTVSPR